MSLVDRTNEKIPLSQHKPQESADWSGLPGWNGYSIPTGTDTSGVTATTLTPAHLDVDADGDSSYEPSLWVNICWTDDEHDSDTIKLTYEEVALLHDRLGRILGLVEGVTDEQVEAAAKVLYGGSDIGWAHLAGGWVTHHRAMARAALEAAKGVQS